MRSEIERLTRELIIDKADLNVAKQALEILLNDKQTSGNQDNVSDPLACKCNINAVMVDMLVTVVTERRKHIEILNSNNLIKL